MALGTLILWVGWFFFNGGSTNGITNLNKEDWKFSSVAIVNTIIAPSTCGLLTLLLRRRITGEKRDERLDYAAFTNGILAGCVSITASCNNVTGFMSIIIGAIGSLVYCFGCVLLNKL